MHLVVFGINHQTAPLSIREKLAFPASILPEALSSLCQNHIAQESVIVSTCNRTEIYAFCADPNTIPQWLAQQHQIAVDAITPFLYQYLEQDAARHLFRVVSGLDSMVLGETQIVGQVKDAMRVAKREHALGSVLNGLFQHAFTTAKHIRSQTSVGAHSVSMAAAGVKLVERIFPSIRDLNLLFIGAGEMIELVATHFQAQSPKRIAIANRTLARAEELAEKLTQTCESLTLSALPERLAEFDVVISSTASALPIVGKGLMERVIRQRRHHPIFMLDLAVPRDIEAEVGDLSDIFLYTVDDLAQIVSVGRQAREQAAQAAEVLIQQAILLFSQWRRQRHKVPLICALRDQAENDRQAVLNKAYKALARGEAPEAVLERLSKQLTNKLMHPPTAALSHQHGTEDEEMADAISRIYRLEPES